MSSIQKKYSELMARCQQQNLAELKNIIDRLSKLTTTEIALCVGEKIVDDSDVIGFYNFLDDQELEKEAALVFSQNGEDPNPEYKQRERQMVDVTEEYRPTEKKREFEQKQRTTQNKIQTPEDYIQKSISFLKKFKDFSSLINQNFLRQFLPFYKQYQKLPLLSKSQTTSKAKKFQGGKKNSLLEEINIADSALYHTSPNHRLRVTQVLALYCFLYKPEMQKVLLQILTGEGKSTTIACLAAILAMRGCSVDIITTNKILATRDVEEKRNFFDLMNLRVAHNISAEENSKQSLEPRKCYEKGTIVYGTPFSYQVDLLYDEYKKRGTRNKRPYQIAIIDEVDSMFVDQKQNQTLLASTFSGFAELKDALKIIWQTIVTHNIVKQDGKLYLYRPGEKQGDIIKGEVRQCLNLIIDDIRKHFQNDVINVEKLQFIGISLDNWILSAISAAHQFKQGVHYTIEKNKIIPVDYRNTGCLQKNVEWENGLHQFLQMKHGLKISVESMTSNFMSNIGHFCRYPRLYGLTGTLGSKKSMQFLEKIYKVSMSEIPPFHQRRLAIDPGFVMYEYDGWMNRICERTGSMMKLGRAVLLICQSIQQADLIHQQILQRQIGAKQIVQMKTGQENNSDRIDSGSIIIATNVAGRGTDLKASEQLIKQGGLHVIITFVPENQRVQMQARGRAGRNGAPGSSQIIMNLTEYSNAVGMGLMSEYDYVTGNLENNVPLILAQIRDQRQFQLMQSDYERVQNLRTRDKIFELFCQATGKIFDYESNKGKRDAIEEEWAMYLKRIEHLKLSNQDKLNGAKQFAEEMSKNSDKFYKKSHGIGRGINQLQKGNYDQARKLFKSVQTNECTKNIQIGGSILEGAAIIKTDGKSQKQIQLGIQAMSHALPILHQRKQLIKGLAMRDLSTENRDIARLMEETQTRQIPRIAAQRNDIGDNSQSQSSQNLKISDKIHNPNDLAQIRVLQAIQTHIMKQMEKAGNINLEKQYLDIRFDPITSLKDLTQGKQEELKEAFEEMAPDLPTIPTIEVKKKKVPWWKRVLVFALGVLQICIGALIVASTGGAAAGFGAFMIQSGVTDCINALFRPEVINDLKSYYSKKALQYGMAAILAGTAALKQIYNAGLKGFTLIRNSSMSEVMKIAATKIGQGLSQGGFDIKGLIHHHLFKGISDRLVGGNEKDRIKVDEITKIVKRPDFKKIVEQGEADQQKMQKKGKEIQSKFETDSQEIIKSIIQRQFNNFMGIIRQCNVCKEHIFILINNSFVQTFKQKFDDVNRNHLYTEMRDFIKAHQSSKTLAKDIIQKFAIDKLIIKSIQNISKDENYQKAIHNANIDLHNKIIQQIQKANIKYKTETDNMYTELNNIKQQLQNNTSITVAEFNRRKAEFDGKVQAYNMKLENRNLFFEGFKKISGDGKNLAEAFIKQGIIHEGKINQNKLQSSNLHPYIKEAVSNVANFTTCDQDFKKQIEIRAYNSFIGIALKALNEVIDHSSKSASKLKDLQRKLYLGIEKK